MYWLKTMKIKGIALIIICVTIGFTAYAIPAMPGWRTVTLSDGSNTEIQLYGDEVYHYYATRQGDIVSQDSNGRWQLQGPVDRKEIHHRRLSSPYMRKQPSTPIASQRRLGGELNLAERGLVVLVNFKNLSFKAYNTREQFDSLFNAQNYRYNAATGSVKKYFHDQSNGQYVPQFDVVGPIEVDSNYNYYGNNAYFYGQSMTDVYVGDMVIQAMKKVKAQKLVDNFSIYDNDDDGYIDFIYFIYAGESEAETGTENLIWPKNASLESLVAYNMTNDAEYRYNWRSGEISQPLYDGKKINNFACSSELGVIYTTTNIKRNVRCGIGPICHEFSHVLGLPDYYDTGYGSNYEYGVTPGSWSLMDGGPYNNQSRTPPSYSIYDKYFMGWISPEVLNDADSITLTIGYGNGYQINNDGILAHARTEGKQFYVENRQQYGWDSYLPGHGMIIWVVDYNTEAWDGNTVNNTANAPRYTLIAADGKIQGLGMESDPFPGSTATHEWNALSNYPLSEINEKEMVIGFNFMGGKKIPDAIDETNINERKCTKRIHEGRVIIEHNGLRYDLLGNRTL